MNITCDVRLEYTASGRSGHKWREGAELSISKDGMSVCILSALITHTNTEVGILALDWNHSVLVLGSGTKKVSFNVRLLAKAGGFLS